MRARVLIAFCIRGERQEPGSEIEVPDNLVRDLLWRGRIEKVAAPAAAESAEVSSDEGEASGPMTTENAPDIVKGKARKGVKHARE